MLSFLCTNIQAVTNTVGLLLDIVGAWLVAWAHKWGQTQLFSPLHAYQEKYADRNEAMAQAYRSGAYAMTDIATFFDVHYMTAK